MPEAIKSCVCVFALMMACMSAGLTSPDGFGLRGVVVDQTGAPIVDAQVFLYASPTLLAQTATVSVTSSAALP